MPHSAHTRSGNGFPFSASPSFSAPSTWGNPRLSSAHRSLPSGPQFGNVETAERIGPDHGAGRIGVEPHLPELTGKLVDFQLVFAEGFGRGQGTIGENARGDHAMGLQIYADDGGDGDNDADVPVPHGLEAADELLHFPGADVQGACLDFAEEPVFQLVAPPRRIRPWRLSLAAVSFVFKLCPKPYPS